ncbi:unnamed protein product, partial [marine sediment metagenome]
MNEINFIDNNIDDSEESIRRAFNFLLNHSRISEAFSKEEFKRVANYQNPKNFDTYFSKKFRHLLERAPNEKNKYLVAGGKRQLLSQIDLFLPKDIEAYVEPFVGGGALFFYLLPENAVLIDNNPVLINAYHVIKKSVDELIELLKLHKNEEEYYYTIRNVDRTKEFKKWSDVEKASRTIYLNKCCYNGLYRVNSKGQFNVPFGKYKNPNFCHEKNLRAVHEVLQNVEIIHDSFKKCVDYANENTFFYIDPPYIPLSKTSNFTSYTQENFTKENQIELKEVIDTLTSRGSKVMLSNSCHKSIMVLYEDYFINVVRAKRVINSKASKRGEIKEVLI